MFTVVRITTRRGRIVRSAPETPIFHAANGSRGPDLLVSSTTPGHALVAADPALWPGAVLGKALRPWSEGRGLIPILVTLQ